MNAPCKDCPRRGCGLYHKVCPDYEEFLRELEKMKKNRDAHKLLYTDKKNRRDKQR